MKKFIFLFIVFAQILSAQHVEDIAGVFSAEFEKNLENKLSRKDLNTTLFVLTLNSIKNSPHLKNLNTKLLKSPENTIGLVIGVKYRKFWYILDKKSNDTLSKEDISKLTLLYTNPYFQKDDYESGIDKLTDELINKFNPTEPIVGMDDFDIVFLNYHINVFLAVSICFLVLAIVIKMSSHWLTFTAAFFRSFALLFLFSFFTLCFYGLIDVSFPQFLYIYPNIVLSYMVRYKIIASVALSVLLNVIMLSSKMRQHEFFKLTPEERRRNRYRSYSSSSYSSSSYSNSSSYSGGGGSFGGGGASGGW